MRAKTQVIPHEKIGISPSFEISSISIVKIAIDF